MTHKGINVLALDTSSPVLSIALKSASGKIREAGLRGFLQHAENLHPLVDQLLKKDKLRLSDIDLFAIGRGPGSFTGLRISHAALKGFLQAVPRPCYGATSLDLITANVTATDMPNLCVCLDARRDRFYVRFYRKTRQGWRPREAARLLSFNEWVKQIPEPCVITGDALDRFGEAFARETDGMKTQLLDSRFWYPRAAALIEFVECLEQKPRPLIKLLGKPRDFVPLYFRLPEPVERKREHAARH